MRIELTGVDTASYGDMTVTSKVGPIGKLARRMVECGLSGVVEIYRNGTKCFTDMSIEDWSGLSTTETDSVSVKMVRYRPFPSDGAAF